MGNCQLRPFGIVRLPQVARAVPAGTRFLIMRLIFVVPNGPADEGPYEQCTAGLKLLCFDGFSSPSQFSKRILRSRPAPFARVGLKSAIKRPSRQIGFKKPRR